METEDIYPVVHRPMRELFVRHPDGSYEARYVFGIPVAPGININTVYSPGSRLELDDRLQQLWEQNADLGIVELKAYYCSNCEAFYAAPPSSSPDYQCCECGGPASVASPKGTWDCAGAGVED